MLNFNIRVRRYDGVCFGLANTWFWLQSNVTIRSKVKVLVERITGQIITQKQNKKCVLIMLIIH